MPAGKPLILHSDTDRHKTRNEARAAAEDAVNVRKDLPIQPPKELKDYPVAQECWRFHVRLYKNMAGFLATPLDQHTLIEYCLGWAYLAELRLLRKIAMEKKRYELWHRAMFTRCNLTTFKRCTAEMAPPVLQLIQGPGTKVMHATPQENGKIRRFRLIYDFRPIDTDPVMA